MHVADFGSGSGAYVLLMAEALGGHGRVTAVDIQKDLLSRIKNEAMARNLRNVEVLWGDLEVPHGSKLGDGVLDFVLISNLLFQVEEPGAVIAEARRTLKRDGRLAMIDWSDSFSSLGPPRGNVISRDAALERAERAGFALVRDFEAGAHHWGMMLRPVQ